MFVFHGQFIYPSKILSKIVLKEDIFKDKANFSFEESCPKHD